jgi:hypothetical protein
MQGFKSVGQAQRFLASYGPISEYFRPRRHRLSVSVYRQEMQQRFNTWHELTNPATAAYRAKPEASRTPSSPLIMLIGNKLTKPFVTHCLL